MMIVTGEVVRGDKQAKCIGDEERRGTDLEVKIFRIGAANILVDSSRPR